MGVLLKTCRRTPWIEDRHIDRQTNYQIFIERTFFTSEICSAGTHFLWTLIVLDDPLIFTRVCYWRKVVVFQDTFLKYKRNVLFFIVIISSIMEGQAVEGAGKVIWF